MEARDLDQVIQAVAIQAAAGRDDDRIAPPHLQLMSETNRGRCFACPFTISISLLELEEMGEQRQGREVRFEGEGDKCFGGEEALGLDGDAWQAGKQLGEGEDGVAMRPATNKAKVGPDGLVERLSLAIRLCWRFALPEDAELLQLLSAPRRARALPDDLLSQWGR